MGRKRDTAIPRAVCARILMNAGAARVSADAAAQLTSELEKIAMEIGVQAARISRHAGRKTVTDADIKLASKE